MRAAVAFLVLVLSLAGTAQAQRTPQQEWADTLAKAKDRSLVLRKDVAHDAKRERSVPDYARIEDYLLLGHDLGDPYLRRVAKIAAEVKTKN